MRKLDKKQSRSIDELTSSKISSTSELKITTSEVPEFAGFLLWQSALVWQRLIKQAFDTYDIAYAQFVVMITLLNFEENELISTQATLTYKSKLDKMTVSKSLNKLVSQGIVDRVGYNGDNRAKSVNLTERGRAMTQKLLLITQQIDEDFFASIRQSDRRAFINTLDKIIHSNEKLSDG